MHGDVPCGSCSVHVQHLQHERAGGVCHASGCSRALVRAQVTSAGGWWVSVESAMLDIRRARWVVGAVRRVTVIVLVARGLLGAACGRCAAGACLHSAIHRAFFQPIAL